jgi:hypothetical protein
MLDGLIGVGMGASATAKMPTPKREPTASNAPEGTP